MTTKTKMPWNVKAGDTVGLWIQIPGSRAELVTGRVTHIDSRKALFHRGRSYRLHTDNPVLGAITGNRFDGVMVVTR